MDLTMWKNISKGDQTVAVMEYLIQIPYIRIGHLDTDERDCPLCKEPFEKASWKLGETLNRPVELGCGHVFGIQCLTRWMLSRSYDNLCPFCRIQILQPGVFKGFEKNIRTCQMIDIIIGAGYEATRQGGHFSEVMRKKCCHNLRKIVAKDSETQSQVHDLERPMMLLEEWLIKTRLEQETRNRVHQRVVVNVRLLEEAPLDQIPRGEKLTRAFISALFLVVSAYTYHTITEKPGSLHDFYTLQRMVARIVHLGSAFAGTLIVGFERSEDLADRLRRFFLMWAACMLWIWNFHHAGHTVITQLVHTPT